MLKDLTKLSFSGTLISLAAFTGIYQDFIMIFLAEWRKSANNRTISQKRA
jgi:hypothetical protein